MRVKEVGGKLQLYRPMWVPEDKRTREKMIGSIDLNAEAASPEILALLDEDEKYQLRADLSKRKAVRDYEACKEALEAGVVDTIGIAIKALSWIGMAQQMTPEQVASMWTALDDMRAAMRKANLPKPKKGS